MTKFGTQPVLHRFEIKAADGFIMLCEWCEIRNLEQRILAQLGRITYLKDLIIYYYTFYYSFEGIRVKSQVTGFSQYNIIRDIIRLMYVHVFLSKLNITFNYCKFV